MESNSNSQSKARLIVVSVFVIGFAAGALALNLYQNLNGSNKKDPRRGGTEFLIGKMNEEVGLTSDQQEKIRKILDETSDLKAPVGECDARTLAEVEHRPVLNDVLIDRNLRQPVSIWRT